MSESNQDIVSFFYPNAGAYDSDGFASEYVEIAPSAAEADVYTPSVYPVGGVDTTYVQNTIVSETSSGANFDLVLDTEDGFLSSPGIQEFKGTLSPLGHDVITMQEGTVPDLGVVETVLTISPPSGSQAYESKTIVLPYVDSVTVVSETDSGAVFSVGIIENRSYLIGGGDYEDITGILPSTPSIPCYVRGSRIATLRGEVAVEDLSLNDRVLSMRDSDPSYKAVRWIGHRMVDCQRHPRPDEVRPIRIASGALSQNIPCRDLLVSPGHRLRLDDGLIMAIDLVNGATIVQEDVKLVEYWHVELDGHDVILAEGAEAESYLDTGNRIAFENGPVRVLHAALDGTGQTPCLPYAFPTQALRLHLVARAETLGWRRERHPCPVIDVGGTLIEPQARGSRYRFLLPAGCSTARLRSNATAPAYTDPTSGDLRRLGLRLARLTLSCAADEVHVPLDHASLSEGFSHPERDEAGWLWRWTDGDAELALDVLSGDREVSMIEITLDDHGHLLYWAQPVRPERIAA